MLCRTKIQYISLYRNASHHLEQQIGGCNKCLIMLHTGHKQVYVSAAMAKATAVNSPRQQMGAVACGARHTCSISCTGQVFCWGWDLHGQCGQGRSTVTVDQPQPVSALGGLKVVGIAAGLAHTVVCTDSGDVYSWGWNSDGQLGLGNDQNRSLPELVAAAVLEDMHIDKVICLCCYHVT